MTDDDRPPIETDHGVEIPEKLSRRIPEDDPLRDRLATDSDSVYVVAEDQLDGPTRLLRAFDNPEAANTYVEDPENAGHLFVEQLTVESEYESE